MNKKIAISVFPIIFCGYLFSQDRMEMSLGSGTSTMSDMSYKISIDQDIFVNTEIKKITNRFKDIDFKINEGVYAPYNQYINMLVGLVSSTITGLKIEIGSNTLPDRYTITANRIMYSFDGWDAFLDIESNQSLSNVKAKSKIDIQSVGFDVYPPDALMGMDQILNLIISKSSTSNIIIKKMTANTEILNNKLLIKSTNKKLRKL